MTIVKFFFRIALLVQFAIAPVAGKASPAAPQARAAAADVALPYRVVRLENGLTLLMQPDPSMPKVGVELWIRGGTREERRGQYGIAHLFEHALSGSSGLIFTNPQNQAAASRTTLATGAGAQPDYLNIYKEVSPEGIEVAIASAADQLEGQPARYAPAQLKIDQDIVVGELRRSAGIEWDPQIGGRLQRGTFGDDHPYGHSVLGIEADVKAATVELMRDWHERFGGAANATLLLVGQFDPPSAEAMVRKYFGPIEPGRVNAMATEYVPAARPIRETMESSYSTGNVFLRWPTPGWGTPDGDRLSLLARILSNRLEEKSGGSSIRSAGAAVEQWELAGHFTAQAELSEAPKARSVEKVLVEELQALLRTGPSAAELARAKAEWKTRFVSSLQNPAWRGSRGEVLLKGLVFRNDAGHYRTQLARIAAASGREIQEVGRRWLSEPGYALHLLPQPARQKVGTVDRAATIGVRPSAPLKYPQVEEHRLAGGGKLILGARPGLPLARVTLAFGAGSGTDDPATSGRARTVVEALPDIMVGGRTLAAAIGAIGGELEAAVDDDFASLSFTVLSEQVEPALRVAFEAIAEGPSDALFGKSVEDARKEVEVARADPMQARYRLLSCALTAPCNAGAIDRRGTVEALSGLKAPSLRRFYKMHYHAANSLVIVSGRADAGRLVKLAALLPQNGRAPARPAPDWPVPTVSGAGDVKIINAPGLPQANLVFAQRLPSEIAADPLRAQLAAITFRQRLMDVLRAQKGWTNEVYPFGINMARVGSVAFFDVPLQTDKVGLAIREIEAEVARLQSQPVAATVLATNKGYLKGGHISLGLNSLEALNRQLLEAERGGFGTAYYETFSRGLSAITPEQVRGDLKALLNPQAMSWAVAGDAAAIKAALDASNIAASVPGSIP